MGAFFEAFSVDGWKLAFQVINFLILLFLLNRFLFKPVLARLDERSAKIAQGLEDAEAAARDRELARAEREAAVSEARKEANEMIARANKIAEDTRNEILADARTEAEKERAMAEIRGQVAELALAAAGKLIRREMDDATQRRLVEDFLAEVSPSKPAKTARS